MMRGKAADDRMFTGSRRATAHDEQMGNPNGDGVDENGLPDDPIATAEDQLGAEVDETEGG